MDRMMDAPLHSDSARTPLKQLQSQVGQTNKESMHNTQQ